MDLPCPLINSHAEKQPQRACPQDLILGTSTVHSLLTTSGIFVRFHVLRSPILGSSALTTITQLIQPNSRMSPLYSLPHSQSVAHNVSKAVCPKPAVPRLAQC